MRIIGGQFRNRNLLIPKGSTVRPSTGQLREALFNICQDIIEEAEFLDLFAGSGAVGLEALSRGARHTTFIEANRSVAAGIFSNIQTLGVEHRATIIISDVAKALKRMAYSKKNFDIIFVDPPYDRGNGNPSHSHQILELIDQLNILREQGKLFIEESKEGAPADLNLQNLKLLDTRRYGRSTLQQWVPQ